MSRAEEFEQLRPLLFAIAYRILGSVSEAEDTVQESWLRYQACPVQPASAKAFLSAAVTRISIDILRSARVRREAYVGPWFRGAGPADQHQSGDQDPHRPGQAGPPGVNGAGPRAVSNGRGRQRHWPERVSGLMAGEVVRAASGKHTRRTQLEAVRQVSLVALIMLVVQYGLGIILNLYMPVPASDAHAGLPQEIGNGPAMLTLHAVLGLALIGAALVLLVRAVRLEDRVIAVLAAAGLTAIGGAFASGEIFVRNGQPGASLAMALLTGVALLCYIGALTWVSAALRRRGPG